MLSHCLERLSNFNCYVAYINPSMGLNASCFFGAQKKHLPVISPGMSLASFTQSHALAPASQAGHGPALQTLGQQKSNIGLMLSACCA